MTLPEFHTQYIFIVDGNEDNHFLFQEVVSELPYLVHLSIARSADEALRTLNEWTELPDLLLLDLDMPVKNGLECLQEIKANKKLASLPVIIFSSSSYPGAINQLYEAGAHLYIHKSDDRSHFKKLIHHVLSINWKEKISPPPRDEFVLTF